MKINRLTTWPHIHICLFDLDCWCEMRRTDAPMRIHYKKKFWDIPVLGWYAQRRHDHMWENAVPVTPRQFTSRSGVPGPTSSTTEESPSSPNQVDPVAEERSP